jgi:hypothetical protein
MLRSMNELRDYTIQAIDGNIGHVKDCYFDDKTWMIRFLVVDTGDWLPGRKVLISPMTIGKANWRTRELPVSKTKECVKNSPTIDTAKPASHQHEIQQFDYYKFPSYWSGVGLWGDAPYPILTTIIDDGKIIIPEFFERSIGDLKNEIKEDTEHYCGDSHLRSCTAVTGYDIDATDGIIGHVKGFLIDEETWAIRYMIIETGNWWLGHRVLMPPQWIDSVRWMVGKIYIKLKRDIVKDAPAFDPTVRLTREKEIEIHRYYGRAGYWENQAEREEVLSPD